MLSIPLTWCTIKAINPAVTRRLAEHKFAIPMSIPIFVLYNCLWNRLPLPSKLLTSIFTDKSESGKYVRTTVKKYNPQVWKNISIQLFDLGYRFPEMNETVSGQFPTALLDAYEASS